MENEVGWYEDMVISGSKGDWDPRRGTDEGGMGKLKRVLLYGDVSASSLGETEKMETRSIANDLGFSCCCCCCSGTLCNATGCPRGGLVLGGACRITLDGGGVKAGAFALVDPPMRVA